MYFLLMGISLAFCMLKRSDLDDLMYFLSVSYRQVRTCVCFVCHCTQARWFITHVFVCVCVFACTSCSWASHWRFVCSSDRTWTTSCTSSPCRTARCVRVCVLYVIVRKLGGSSHMCLCVCVCLHVLLAHGHLTGVLYAQAIGPGRPHVLPLRVVPPGAYVCVFCTSLSAS